MFRILIGVQGALVYLKYRLQKSLVIAWSSSYKINMYHSNHSIENFKVQTKSKICLIIYNKFHHSQIYSSFVFITLQVKYKLQCFVYKKKYCFFNFLLLHLQEIHPHLAMVSSLFNLAPTLVPMKQERKKLASMWKFKNLLLWTSLNAHH